MDSAKQAAQLTCAIEHALLCIRREWDDAKGAMGCADAECADCAKAIPCDMLHSVSIILRVAMQAHTPATEDADPLRDVPTVAARVDFEAIARMMEGGE